jgi:uncharacterized membrane protein (DUF106 family)
MAYNMVEFGIKTFFAFDIFCDVAMYLHQTILFLYSKQKCARPHYIICVTGVLVGIKIGFVRYFLSL